MANASILAAFERMWQHVVAKVGEKADRDHTHDGYMENTNPSGTGTFSLNRKANTTIGTNSVAVGSNNTASGNNSHAEGANTTASGVASHTEGAGTTASNNFSHAEGNITTASGIRSHAEGYRSVASGPESHAEGYETTASGTDSHAEGNITIASGSYSHAEGFGTISATSTQHVQGKYNIIDPDYDAEDSTKQGRYAHIIGNGTETNRSNAHTVDWDGNAWYKGDVYVGGSDQDSGAKLVKATDIISVANGGTGQTSIVDTTYTTARYRASSIHSSETNPGSNGVICWTYE